MVDTTWPLPPTPPTAPLGGDGAAPTVPPPPADGPPPRRRKGGAIAAVVALAVTTSTAGGYVGQRLGSDDAPPAATAAPAPLTAPAASGSTGGGLDVAAVLDLVEGAVADIQARGSRANGQGSGVVFTADGLVAATLGSSEDVRVGQDVVAIGNALGLRGDPSVTRGIVSALDRSIGNLSGLLQTDAAINSGNSGGPLVDAAGRVIGINTAVAVQSNAQNIGFAIPIDDARSIAERIVSGAQPTSTGFLGVSTTDATDAATGATVIEVTAGSPAAGAGIRPGDVIVAVDGTAVSGASALGRLVSARAPGDEVTITVVRDGQDRDLRVTLGRR